MRESIATIHFAPIQKLKGVNLDLRIGFVLRQRFRPPGRKIVENPRLMDRTISHQSVREMRPDKPRSA